MGREYYDTMDKIQATQSWKARTLTAIEAAEAGPSPRRRPVLRVLAVAAVCTALFATALAVSPGLREALADALGGFAPYSSEVAGISATDQGIEIRAVSALSDGSIARVYLEVQDKTGDRVDAYTEVDIDAMMRPEAQYASGSYGGGVLVDYDEERRTGLFQVEFSGNGEPAHGGVLDIVFGSVMPGVQRGTFQFPQSVLTEEAVATKTLDTGETVLVPEQTPAELEGTDLISLSSCGFGSDSLLHVQFRLHEQGVNWEELWLTPFIDSRSDDFERIKRYTPQGVGALKVHFEEDGQSYWDVRYAAVPADLPDILIRQVDYAVTTRERIYGDWRLSVPLEDVPHKRLTLREKIGSVVVEDLDITTLGIATESDPEGGPCTLVYPATVFLADGSTVSAGAADSTFHTNSYTANHWSFDQPVDTEQVVGVAFGYWYIPIDGETAGPGYWLAELPG